MALEKQTFVSQGLFLEACELALVKQLGEIRCWVALLIN
jgi:hypothetical protein